MLTVGDALPAFELDAVVGLEKGKEFGRLGPHSFPGKWLVLFTWPLDFTFVCPTELAELGRRERDFAERGAQLLGASIDSRYAHLAWRQQHPDLRALGYPMLADHKRELTTALGVLHRDEGVALRATFIVDPRGVIRWVCCNDLDVGRSVDEIVRVLDALQTGEMCPCDWHKGQATLGS